MNIAFEPVPRTAAPSDDLEDFEIEDFMGGEEGPDPDHQSGYGETSTEMVEADDDNADERAFADEGWAHRGSRTTGSKWYDEGYARGKALANEGVSIEDAPAPLSGEWAGESIPEIFGSWDDATDEAMEEYEEGYYSAFTASAARRRAARVRGSHQGRTRWERVSDEVYGAERGGYHMTAVKDRREWRWVVGKGKRPVVTAGTATNLEDAQIAAEGWVIQRGGATEHEAPTADEEGTSGEVFESEPGDDAADVASVPTPGQEVADYPQPEVVTDVDDDWPVTEARRNPALAAFRRRVQASIREGKVSIPQGGGRHPFADAPARRAGSRRQGSSKWWSDQVNESEWGNDFPPTHDKTWTFPDGFTISGYVEEVDGQWDWWIEDEEESFAGGTVESFERAKSLVEGWADDAISASPRITSSRRTAR